MSQSESSGASGRLGVVVIGRNEGELLARALGSIGTAADAVVYADSDSSDDSVDRVRREFPNVHVVRLDPSRAMTPARGRNEGMARLLEELPNVEFVQFLDGDCDLAADWLTTARKYLVNNPKVGLLCGRLRERERERNRYHRLADMEWAQPAGEVDDLGGIMMVRREVWEEVGGQNSGIAAGEEREFSCRVLAAGWTAMRLAEDMAHHDIDMARFSQWWTRTSRMGHSCAQGLWIYRDRRHLQEVVSLAVWGGVVPTLAVLGALPTLGTSLPLAGLAYRRLWRRVAADREAGGDRMDDAKLYASAIVAGKFAGALGVARFVLRTLPAGRGGRRN